MEKLCIRIGVAALTTGAATDGAAVLAACAGCLVVTEKDWQRGGKTPEGAAKEDPLGKAADNTATVAPLGQHVGKEVLLDSAIECVAKDTARGAAGVDEPDNPCSSATLD